MATSGAVTTDKLIQKIMEYRSGMLDETDLLASIQPSMLTRNVTNPDNVNILWALAAMVMEKRKKPIETVLEKWIEYLTYVDFLVSPKTDEFRKNRSVLWFLAATTVIDPDSNVFEIFWARWQKSIQIEHLILSDVEGISPVFWLGKSAKTGAKYFIEIWSKWKNFFLLHPNLLLAKPIGDHEGQSLQWLILDAAQTQETMRACVEDMLRHSPDVFRENDLSSTPQNENSIYEKISSKEDDWNKKILNWIIKRNEFLSSLEQLKTFEPPISPSELQTIKELAQNAFNVGYINAFYDLVKLLIKIKLDTKELEACFLLHFVPKDSHKYIEAQIYGANGYVDLAMTEDLSSQERRNFLEKAWDFAQSIPEKSPEESLPARPSLIERILGCYVNEGRTTSLESVFPDELLMEIQKTTNNSRFFALCEEALQIYKSDKRETHAKKVADLGSTIEMLTVTDDRDEVDIINSANLAIAPGFAAAAAAAAVATTTVDPASSVTQRSGKKVRFAEQS